MKLTLQDHHRTITIEEESFCDVHEALELCTLALLAQGYHKESVDRAVLSLALTIEEDSVDA